MRAYLDSCIVIYVVEDKFDLPTQLRITEFTTSDLVLLECLVKPLELKDRELITDYREYLSDLVDLPLHRGVFERAAMLRAEHRLKTPDAIHLAARWSMGATSSGRTTCGWPA